MPPGRHPRRYATARRTPPGRRTSDDGAPAQALVRRVAAKACQAPTGKDSTAPARSVVSRTTTPCLATRCLPAPGAAVATSTHSAPLFPLCVLLRQGAVPTSTQSPPLLPLYVLLRQGALPTSTQLVPLLPL